MVRRRQSLPSKRGSGFSKLLLAIVVIWAMVRLDPWLRAGPPWAALETQKPKPASWLVIVVEPGSAEQIAMLTDPRITKAATKRNATVRGLASTDGRLDKLGYRAHMGQELPFAFVMDGGGNVVRKGPAETAEAVAGMLD